MSFHLFRHKKKNIPKTILTQQQINHHPNALIKNSLKLHREKKDLSQAGFLNNGSPMANLIKKFISHDSISNNNFQQYGNNRFEHNTIKLLRYKRLTDDRHHYLVIANDYTDTIGYADIIRIGGASLSDLPPRIVRLVLSRFINFLRQDLVDYTFFSLPLPNDSRRQQHQWNQILERVDTILYTDSNLTTRRREQLYARRQAIKETLQEFKEIDLNLINQGFVMMVFDKTIKQLNNDVNLTYQFGEKALKLAPMSVHDKEVFLSRMNNPSKDNQ